MINLFKRMNSWISLWDTSEVRSCSLSEEVWLFRRASQQALIDSSVPGVTIEKCQTFFSRFLIKGDEHREAAFDRLCSSCSSSVVSEDEVKAQNPSVRSHLSSLFCTKSPQISQRRKKRQKCAGEPGDQIQMKQVRHLWGLWSQSLEQTGVKMRTAACV